MATARGSLACKRWGSARLPIFLACTGVWILPGLSGQLEKFYAPKTVVAQSPIVGEAIGLGTPNAKVMGRLIIGPQFEATALSRFESVVIATAQIRESEMLVRNLAPKTENSPSEGQVPILGPSGPNDTEPTATKPIAAVDRS